MGRGEQEAKLGELINSDGVSPLEINERGQDGERTETLYDRRRGHPSWESARY